MVAGMRFGTRIATAFMYADAEGGLPEWAVLGFAGRHWREIGWPDWESHPDAFYAFVPEAFIFYLPSLLLGALDAPQGQLLAADA